MDSSRSACIYIFNSDQEWKLEHEQAISIRPFHRKYNIIKANCSGACVTTFLKVLETPGYLCGKGGEHDHQAHIRATGRHGPCNRLPEMQLVLDEVEEGAEVWLWNLLVLKAHRCPVHFVRVVWV